METNKLLHLIVLFWEHNLREVFRKIAEGQNKYSKLSLPILGQFQTIHNNLVYSYLFIRLFNFRDAPRINSRTVNLEKLKSLPEGTVGKTYLNFLEKNVS